MRQACMSLGKMNAKYAHDTTLQLVADILNIVVQKGKIPGALSSGYMVPVLKSGKDPKQTDS